MISYTLGFMNTCVSRFGWLFGLAAMAAFSGCLGPSRVGAPEWDVEKITDGCMEQCDKDGDGLISKKELDNAPGLKYAAKQLDADGDNQLSRDEVRQRFEDYQGSKAGAVGFTCYVLVRGRPLGDAKLRLVPEPFLADYIAEAEGEVYDEATGIATAQTISDEDLLGVRPGMYRVEITSPSFQVGAKYNTETTLGVEVAPFTNPFLEAGGIKFNVGK